MSRDAFLQGGVQIKKTRSCGLFQVTKECPEPVFNEVEVVRQLVLLSLVAQANPFSYKVFNNPHDYSHNELQGPFEFPHT